MRGLGSRAAALDVLAATASGDPLDLLVVGGGITGAGIALDAASRGLKVGLVERFDFASGTSSKSSKLIHGGLRYLEQREFGLMREACTERDLLRRLAPHLVEPIPFVLPVSRRLTRAKFGVGLWAYDALASFKNLRLHRHVDGAETESLVPALPRGQVQGGFVFYDCKTDDVRLVMEVLIQARRYGATAANYCAARNLEGGEEGCVALVEDVLADERFEISARRIVCAAGVWADRVEALARPDAAARLRPSKGVHLLLPRDRIPLDEAAAFVPDVERRRMLFVVPWLDSVLVGTTDTHFHGSLDDPSVDEDDRAYCLDAVNTIFGTELGTGDIAGAYAGLRPLIAGERDATADLSRRHSVYDIAPGIRGITGGKLTTYRRMARDAVDRVASDLGVTAKSRTRWIRLGSRNVDALQAAVSRRTHRLGLSSVVEANLVRCYGDRALDVLDVAAQEDALGPLAPDHQPIGAEALYCARHEMTVTLADLLSRRTRLALTDPAGGIGHNSSAQPLLGGELGWSPAEKERQLLAYRHEVERERGMPFAVPPLPAPNATRPQRAMG
ncbi:MAG: glycerol-3-phosphate dehydrogenase/oxidase [Actinomycetota bacterium]